MRLIVLSLLAVSLAGCTLGTPETEPFEATCPTWIQGPGAPGAQVASGRYISDQDGQLKEFHLEGSFVHHPPTGKYELNGMTLDFIQFALPATDGEGQLTKYAVDGYYSIRAYRTDLDTNAANHTEADRGAPLLFRDLTKSAAQYSSVVEIRPNADNTWQDETYRIELAPASGDVNPSSLYIEYIFHADADNDDDTPSQGGWKSQVTFWYRQPC
ncbi:MAG: hypothetical protein ACPHID_00615 [Thermoplasmatota archaeon]